MNRRFGVWVLAKILTIVVPVVDVAPAAAVHRATASAVGQQRRHWYVKPSWSCRSCVYLLAVVVGDAFRSLVSKCCGCYGLL
jgi:hypothetical protein